MRGTELPVRDEVITLGRSTESSIQVHDTLISRIHCKLEWENGKWYLNDLGSTNGTYYQECRVREIFLNPGMVFPSS